MFPVDVNFERELGEDEEGFPGAKKVRRTLFSRIVDMGKSNLRREIYTYNLSSVANPFNFDTDPGSASSNPFRVKTDPDPT